MEKLFGDKEKFAIEIKIVDEVAKSNLRVWINNSPLGYFKRKGELIYSIRNLKKLIYNRHNLYENIFDKMSPKDVFHWILGEDLLENSTPESRSEFRRRHNYVLFLGDQLDEFPIVCYFKNEKFYWIICNVQNKRMLFFYSNERDVIHIIEKYINWYESMYEVE